MHRTTVEQAATGDLSWNHRLARAASVFFFEPASARPLAALRISLSAVLLGQAWLLRNEVLDLVAHDGIVQGDLAPYLGGAGAPRLGWLVERLAPLGISESSCLHAVCGLYIASLVGLGLGLFTRVASVLAWFLHWALLSTGGPTSYGADTYAHIFLFYLMWVPAGGAWSLDVARGRASRAPSEMARLGLRVMQLHLCVSYLASGIQKSVGIQWWNGELIWRALSLPIHQQIDTTWLASVPWLCQIACWSALFIELGYCVFIWPRRTRRLWIAAIVALHLGIALFLGLGVFGVIMCALTLSLFGVSPEPREAALGAEARSRRSMTLGPSGARAREPRGLAQPASLVGDRLLQIHMA
ncbi:MAG: HTTM domain-containing protein, partial [Byssovorax sp.]